MRTFEWQLVQTKKFETVDNTEVCVREEKVLESGRLVIDGAFPLVEDFKEEHREARGNLKPSEVVVNIFEYPFHPAR